MTNDTGMCYTESQMSFAQDGFKFKVFLFIILLSLFAVLYLFQTWRKSPPPYFFSLIYAVWSFSPVADLLELLVSLFLAQNPFGFFPDTTSSLTSRVTFLSYLCVIYVFDYIVW